VEKVFGLTGLGNLMLGASAGTIGFDLPVIAGVILVVTLAIVLFNLIVRPPVSARGPADHPLVATATAHSSP
jgi:hypothetical protein